RSASHGRGDPAIRSIDELISSPLPKLDSDEARPSRVANVSSSDPNHDARQDDMIEIECKPLGRSAATFRNCLERLAGSTEHAEVMGSQQIDTLLSHDRLFKN